jgi:hypothetical protein
MARSKSCMRAFRGAGESLQRLQRPGVTRPIREFCELPILKPAENSKPTEETIPTPIKLHESA